MSGFTSIVVGRRAPQVIPTRPIPSQILAAQLNGQSTTLNIRQLGAGLFMNVLLNNTPIVTGVLCENLTVIVRDSYLGYSGDFAWFDTQGSDDPIYTGLNSRWFLAYFAPGQLPGLLA